MTLSYQLSPLTALKVASHIQAQRSGQRLDRDLLVLVEVEDHVHLAQGPRSETDLKHNSQNKRDSSVMDQIHCQICLLAILQQAHR